MHEDLQIDKHFFTEKRKKFSSLYVSMVFSSGSMCHSHQKAMIRGGSMKECTPFLGAVRRKQFSQPSRQYQMPSSSEPEPSQRATSFGRVFMFRMGIRLDLR
jgi:hypothetical protein